MTDPANLAHIICTTTTFWTLFPEPGTLFVQLPLCAFWGIPVLSSCMDH
jgi:hypothetical protein